MSDFYVELPILVKPRLPKGRFHRLVLTPDRLEIKTWANIYGNKESETLLTLSYRNISEMTYKKPLPQIRLGKIKLTVYDEGRGQGQHQPQTQRKLEICAVGKGNQTENDKLTAFVADILQKRYEQRDVFIEGQFVLPLSASASLTKFLYGFTLFSGIMLLGGVRTGMGFVPFFATFLFFPSLIAIGIDYIRLHTGWPVPIKFFVSLIIFLVGFFVMMYTFFVLETRGLLWG